MPDIAEQSAGSHPDSPLTARLLRRAREPLGVIDVRHPEHLGTRGAAWMGQRLEMLDRWKTRYGLAAAEAPAERAPVAAAAHPFAMRAALPRAEAAPDAPVPAQLRVKRPGEARDARPAHGTAAKTADAVASDTPLALRAPEILAPHTGDPVPQVLRQRAGGAESPPHASLAARSSGPPAEATSPQLLQGPQSAAPSTPPVASAAPGPPPVISRTTVDAQTPALILRRKVSDAPLPVARAVATTPAAELPVAQSKPASVLPQSDPPVQARTAGTSPPALILPSRISAKAEEPTAASRPAAVGRPPSPPIAPEIPAARPPVGAAPIVWRRAEAEGSIRPLAPPVSSAPSMQIMRAPSAASPSPTPSAALSSIPASSGGPDVGHLAGQVTRLIARQLTVDRERRGMAP